MKLILFVLGFAYGTLGSAQAQDDVAALRANPAELRVRVDAAAPAWLAETKVPSAAVALIAEGKVAWTAVYGERAPGEPAGPDTLYNVASLTKPVVAETLLRLVAQGRIDLDAPMSDVFADPDLALQPMAARLTLRHALSHRTGFPRNWRWQMEGGKLQIAWEPGTRASYAGENFVLAARYAAAKTGTRLDRLARNTIFADFAMADTRFTPDASWKGRVAMVRGQDGEIKPPDNSPEGSAADDLHTTIGDYARFAAAAMRGEGLTPELTKARGTIYDDQVEQACPPGIIPSELCPRHAGFGLGWMVYDSGYNRFLMHDGSDWGERTMVVIEPEKRYGVVIFTSGASGRRLISAALELIVADPKLNALVAAQAEHDRP